VSVLELTSIMPAVVMLMPISIVVRPDDAQVPVPTMPPRRF
jgi:hypothetical protein